MKGGEDDWHPEVLEGLEGPEDSGGPDVKFKDSCFFGFRYRNVSIPRLESPDGLGCLEALRIIQADLRKTTLGLAALGD